MGEEGEFITRHEGPNQVVHIRTDSNGILDDMFNKVLKNPSAQNTVPYADRRAHLPQSFFIQPKSGGELHGNVGADKRIGQSSGQIQHVRSRSSPASINQSLSLPPQAHAPPSVYQQSCTPSHHIRQKSVPASSLLPQRPQLCNQVTLNNLYRAGNTADGKIIFQNRQTLEYHPDSPQVRDEILGPLPVYWAKQTDQGQVYYIDHFKRTTTWFDPRLPEDLQRPFVNACQRAAAVSSSAFASQNNPAPTAVSAAPPQHEFPQSLINNATQSHSHSNFLSDSYSNHVHAQQPNATSLPVQQQHSPQPVLSPQQLLNLKQLEMEREMMKLRQKEIQQQEGLPPRHVVDYDMAGSPMSALSNLQLSDPFLGAYHGRQESGDSGFSSSTRHTPENYLSQTMEEMTLYHGDGWDSSANILNGPTGSSEGAMAGQSVNHDVPMDGPEELTDFLLSDLESVLSRTDKNDPFITWL